MRILFATDNYYPRVSGVAVFVERIATELKKNGHSVLVIAPSRKFCYEEFSHKGIKVCGLPSVPSVVYNGVRLSPPFFIKNLIRKIIVKFKPDIIHLQSHFIIVRAVLPIAKQFNIPTIGTNHFLPENLIYLFHLPKFAENLAYNRILEQYKNFFEKVDILTTPTKTAAKFLNNMGISRHIHPISNGIYLNRFSPKNKGDDLKERLKIPDKPILLYVGRLDKEKKIDIIIKALPLILKRVNVHMVIAGKGTEIDELMNLVKKLNIENYVTFTGYVPEKDLPNLYAMADCFVIASTAELQSIATMEAMASGLPVVAPNAMALPELVRNNQNGYLFEPDNTESISKYVTLIISNNSLQKKFSKKSLEIIKNHDIKNTISKFQSLYQLLQKKN